LLGLPAEQEPASGTPKGQGGRAEFGPASTAAPKKIRINKQEYTWDVSTLDSLVAKWRERQCYEQHKTPDASWSLVVINNRTIPAIDFSSVPISDGDEIFIVLGRGRCR
jgi:hypothetical protein